MSCPAFSMLRAWLAKKYREHVGEEPGAEQFSRLAGAFRVYRLVQPFH
jgi:hypothetical protein